ncbi:MAG: ectonucleotide pyrophosphatase/phosphodiesterase [Bacteroidota bacterium]
MPRSVFILLSLSLIGMVFGSSCNRSSSPSGRWKVEAAEKPYLILISLDGFRWDYVERFHPPHLSQFIAEGVQAKSLIPSFPSKTFPNHYTVATGMYPDKHGLIANTFYSYAKDTTYIIRDRSLVEDSDFYRGTPIWVHASKAGMVTASYFFVGTEAKIQGTRPDYYFNYDGSVPNDERVRQALEWLSYPKSKRPQLITMYFSDMDNIGHGFGPNNDQQLQTGLMRLDSTLGKLFDGIKATKLPVNVLIVSDHGMLEVPVEKYLPQEKLENDALYRTVSNGALVSIHPHDPAQTDSIFQLLQNKADHYQIYKTEDCPLFEAPPTDPNWGSLQIIPEDGHYFIWYRGLSIKKKSTNTRFGEHGFDPNLLELHGIFYANGPAFKAGYTLPPIKNIHVYPLMCEILGLEVPEDVDGELNATVKALKN